MDFLKGKKTYITMVVVIVLGALGGWNEYCAGEEVVSFCREINVPNWVFSVLGTLGIYTRAVAKP